MKNKSLENISNRFNKLKVLIIGDVMIDSYIWGKVDRISPEAPVPIVHATSKENRMGGAANVAENVKALGAEPILFSVIGKDAAGDSFIDLLKEKKISTKGMVISESRETTVKERILASSQQLLRIDKETTEALCFSDKNLLLQKIDVAISKADVIIFEDYDKGVIDKNLINIVVREAKALNIPVVVDPKKKNFLDYKNVDLFKPNLKEIKEGLKIDFDPNNSEELKDAVKKLLDHLDAASVLMTLSEQGVYIDNKTQQHQVPAHIRQISDVSGAGDTVISVAALCLALKLPLKFIAELSNLGGGLVCEHLGVVPINKEELFKEASKHKLNLHVE